MSTGDLFQLDAFNHESNEYEFVDFGDDSGKLADAARLLGLKAWRVWNRTTRAARNRMLPPTPRTVKTFDHSRRWSLTHRAPAKTSTVYKDYTP